MKKNKKLYGLLAGVLALSVCSPLAVSHIAKADTLEKDIVASYSFDSGSLLNDGDSENKATAVLKGLGSYTGDLSFGEDRSGDENGKSIKLNGYGLELNEKNLGDNFTVSLWVKPDGTLAENQSVVFLGYHSPEKWYGLAGQTSKTNKVKIWCNDANDSAYNWQTKSSVTLSSDSWHNVVITGDGTTHATYFDGKLVTTSTFNNVLSGSNQDIYIGTTNWDTCFAGLVDDVLVYDKTLSAGDVERLYTGKTAEEILDENGISVKDVNTAISMDANVEVTVPEAATDDVKYTYELADESIASVSKDGLITGKAVGETTLTVTAKLGSVTKTATATVKVASLDSYLLASYSFEDNILDSTEKTTATMVNKGLSAYTGDVTYTDGVNGKALSIESYGIDLGLKNVGTDYTLSFFVKPESTMANNQIMMLLGYHSPELWTAISGTGTDGTYKLWGRNESTATTTGNITSLGWTIIANPTITTGEWSFVTLVGTDGKITMYVNGKAVATAGYNNPLCGENQDILFGANYWDTCFDGAFDEIKVYNFAMTESQVATVTGDDCKTLVQTNLDAVTALTKILGENESAEEIKYDLTLPTKAMGETIEWVSSDTSVLGNDGKVIKTPDKDTKVTLTATLTVNNVKATMTQELILKALDLTNLNALISQAKSIDQANLTEASASRLEAAIEEAEAANTFATVDAAEIKLPKAIAAIEFTDDYADPFSVIPEAVEGFSLTAGDTSSAAFTIPEAVSDMVTVAYASEDEDVATYSDGVVKAVAAGQTIVTATVTAKADGWTMEYSTTIDVAKKSVAQRVVETVKETVTTVIQTIVNTVKDIWNRITGNGKHNTTTPKTEETATEAVTTPDTTSDSSASTTVDSSDSTEEAEEAIEDSETPTTADDAGETEKSSLPVAPIAGGAAGVAAVAGLGYAIFTGKLAKLLALLFK